MQIIKDDLNGKEIIALLEEHLSHMKEITPAEDVHALDLNALRATEITFWTLWENDDLMGCGALKDLGNNTGEIKSMRTANAHRRKGVAAKILEHIITVASSRDYDSLYLETGSFAAFAPARALYQRYGFTFRGPFSDYEESPNNVFMGKSL